MPRTAALSLPVPAESGSLVAGARLAVNDCAWTSGADVAGYTLVHRDVPTDLARRLGIKSLQAILAANAEYAHTLNCPSKGAT